MHECCCWIRPDSTLLKGWTKTALRCVSATYVPTVAFAAAALDSWVEEETGVCCEISVPLEA